MSLHSSDQEEIKPQWKARLQDLLSPATRGKRKLLLLISTTSLLFVVLGLFPTKIETLGITFESKDRTQMVMLIGAINIYALVGFILYAWSDFHLVRRSLAASTTGYIDSFMKGKATFIESLNFYLRIAFDFGLPLAFGSYAIFRLYEILKVSAL